jgi:hypothetical protein
MKIGIYALCKNEEQHVFDWAESTDGADVVVVTDTGSTDTTVQRLNAAGVKVATGYVCPWRWDDAHNLSLNHLPPDVDVAIRLDLDERLQPGWREAIERAWVDGVNNIRYRYVWSWADHPGGQPGLVFHCDRVHARHGFRWGGATHEGLVCWKGERQVAVVDGLEIWHYRDQGKKHGTDLELLRVAVAEAPHDARMRWYLARECDYQQLPEAAAQFAAYLKMPGGQATERSYALRALHRLTGEEAHLHKAASEAPWEADAWERLAFVRYQQQDWREVYGFAKAATEAPGPTTHATDPNVPTKALDLAAVAAWQLGKRPEALQLAEAAVARCPGDPRLQANVEAMRRQLEAAA